jgi:hypothetical protein
MIHSGNIVNWIVMALAAAALWITLLAVVRPAHAQGFSFGYDDPQYGTREGQTERYHELREHRNHAHERFERPRVEIPIPIPRPRGHDQDNDGDEQNYEMFE